MLRLASGGAHCLFLYSWEGPVLVLGHGQRVSDSWSNACERIGVAVMRRVTGGTGVLHRNDLAVSLALPASHPWARGIGDLYDRFLDVVHAALEEVGVRSERARAPFPSRRERSPICFENVARETLLVGGRKAVGCAQARRRGAVLVHAFLLLGLEPDLAARVFDVSVERVVTAMAPLPVHDRAALRRSLVSGFARALGLDPHAVGADLVTHLANHREHPYDQDATLCEGDTSCP